MESQDSSELCLILCLLLHLVLDGDHEHLLNTRLLQEDSSTFFTDRSKFLNQGRVKVEECASVHQAFQDSPFEWQVNLFDKFIVFFLARRLNRRRHGDGTCVECRFIEHVELCILFINSLW